MIDLRPVFFGLAGAGRLVRFDLSGVQVMVKGRYGFWTSLAWSMALVFPLYLLLMILRFDPGQTEGGRYFIANLEIYALSWLIFPLVMERVCHFIERTPKYLTFITAYNWLACLYNTIYMLIALAQVTGMIAHETAAALSVGLLFASLVWVAYLGRHTLDLPYSAMVGIVVLDLFISIMISLLGAALRAA